MYVNETSLPEVKIIEPRVFRDERGFFFEAFQHRRYAEALQLETPFVQDNVSFSERGVLRGLHFQFPRSQGKLVTVLMGEVLDVAVDIRSGSPTFGKWVGVPLNAETKRQVWIPQGFAHGFVVLSGTALVTYKCNEYYCPEDDRAIRWNDPDLRINWTVASPKISEKDAQAPHLADLPEAALPHYKEAT